ncbi:Asparagine synthetase B [glutamine-hydrolyzing] [anaerobic digester metagenome]
MCAIVGLRGNFTGQNLKMMLETLKHRGPDGSGVFVDGKIIKGNLDSLNIPDGSLGMGHNLLSIVGSEVVQPLECDGFIMVCNGEIYNYKKLKEKLDEEFTTDSDCEIILHLVKKFHNTQLENPLLESVKETISHLDGDYAFAVYDGKDCAVVRDPLGVKPIYYGESSDISAFASERKALWNVGIEKVETLPPDEVLYNGRPVGIGSRLNINLYNEVSNNSNLGSAGTSREEFENRLKELLIRSVEKRIEGLSKVGIIFSGGVDSTILAKLCMDMGVETELYTVGNENSQDVKFAKKAASYMQLPLHIKTVDESMVRSYTGLVLNAIEEFNIMKLGVGMPSYIASEMAHSHGLKVMLSGQGADELFAGYNRYLQFYHEKGETAQKDLKGDVLNLYHVNLQRDDSVTMKNSVELRVPFLDLEVVDLAMQIPMKYKINNKEDKLRKCILREVAADIGVMADIVKRPKKAAQYGSGIHKILVKKVLNDETYKNKLERSLGPQPTDLI